MNHLVRLLLPVLLLGSASAVIAEEVTCESIDERRAECSIRHNNDVRLVRQLSSTDCREGRNWGTTRRSIWVSEGCRAVFSSNDQWSGGHRPGQGGYLPDRVVCESDVGDRRQCAIDTSSGVRLVRQLSSSNCVENRSWGMTRGAVWVGSGCRGEFAANRSADAGNQRPGGGLVGDGSRTRVICESDNNRREECQIDTRGDIVLTRQLSSTRCVQGSNWGVVMGSIWVSGGCRAEFESRLGNGGSNRPAPPYGNGPGSHGGINGPDQVTCESENDRRTECPFNTRGDIRLLRQLSKTQCIEGRTWGQLNRAIWVDNGCRGVFGRSSGGGRGR